MIRNIVIADPGLLSEVGHHFHVSMTYADAVDELGLKVSVLAHRDFVKKKADPRIVHAFTYNPYDRPRWLRQRLPRALVGPTLSTLAKDLLRVGPSVPLSDETLVLFHSCSLSLINDLIDYFLLVPPEKTPCFMVRLIYEGDPSGATYPHWYLQQLRRKIRFSGLANRKLFFFAETKALADQMASILEVSCERVHHLATNQDPDATAGIASADHVSIAFLGDARQEKGFDILPEVAESIAADDRLAVTCELIVQTAVGALDPDEAERAEAVKNELFALSHRLRISLVESRLDDHTYNGFVNEMDIALLLHDPDVYRTRGSAIYYDAALAGKCLIVRERSSMAKEVGLAGLVVWKDGERFIDVLDRAIDIRGKLRDGILDPGVTELCRQCDPKNILNRLLEIAQKGADEAIPPVAVQVLPAWFGEGSSHVFRAQTEYLANRGFRVIDVVVLTWDGAGQPEPEFYEWLFEGTRHHSSFYTFFIQRPPEHGALERDSLSSGAYAKLSYSYESKWLLDADLPASLIRAIGALDPKIALVNYAQYAPARGFLGDCKVILEMHDLRSRQYAIERGSDTLAELDSAQEVHSALTADGIAFISQHEEAVFKRLCGRPVNSAAAFPITRHDGEGVDLSGVVNRLQLIESVAATSDEQRVSIHSFVWPPATGSARLMFAGSGHVSNAMSLDWFLSEVFLPRLHPLGMTLNVFGTIANRFRQPIPGVIFYGRVEHLQPFYGFADIVVLPITTGSGLPIKSLDAVRAGAPLVATSKAFEGIADAGDLLDFFDEPSAFADEVIRLANDDKARARLQRQLARLAATLLNAESYYKSLDSIVKRSGAVLPKKSREVLLSDGELNELRMARLFPNWEAVRTQLSAFMVLDQFLRLEFKSNQSASPTYLTLRSDAPPLRILTRVGDGPIRRWASEGGVASLLVLPQKGRLPSLEIYAAGKNNFVSTSLLELDVTASGDRAMIRVNAKTSRRLTARPTSQAPATYEPDAIDQHRLEQVSADRPRPTPGPVDPPTPMTVPAEQPRTEPLHIERPRQGGLLTAEAEGQFISIGSQLLDDHQSTDRFHLLDVSWRTASFGSITWPQVKFKFSLDGNHCSVELRKMSGWPEMFEDWPDVDRDDYGLVMRLADNEASLARFKEWPIRKDHMLVQLIMTLLPMSIELAARAAHLADVEIATWHAAASRISGHYLQFMRRMRIGAAYGGENSVAVTSSRNRVEAPAGADGPIDDSPETLVAVNAARDDVSSGNWA